MPKRKDEELTGEPARYEPETYAPNICFGCGEEPRYLVSSWRLTDRPLCNGCAVPYAMSFLYTIRKIEK